MSTFIIFFSYYGLRHGSQEYFTQLTVIINKARENIGPWVSVVMFLSSVLGAILSVRPYYMNRILSIISVFATLVLTSLLFQGGFYDGFLRMTRFGGGLEVTLHRHDKEPLKERLFLLTAAKAIMLTGSNRFLEVPVKDIEMIEYEQRPDWKLPPSLGVEQSRYLFSREQ